MRAKLELVLLIFALGTVGAFVVSFALGWRPGARTVITVDSSAVRTPAVPDVARRSVRVEVLNASGKSGLARVATDKLRDNGFDVVYFGNASGPVRPTSTVIDRVGKPEGAQTVAATLNILSVQSKADTSRLVDASVILGSDFGHPKK